MATPSTSQVVKHERYVAVDPLNNNNKFWQYTINTDGTIHYQWGRMGGHISDKIAPYDEKKLSGQIREKLSEKHNPPYTLFKGVGNIGQTADSGEKMAKERIKELVVKEVGAGCSVTSALLKKLAEENRHELNVLSGGEMNIDLETGIVSTVMGVITLDAVKEARQLLDQMAPFVKNGKTDDYSYSSKDGLLGRYLRLVPQKTPARKGWHVDFIDLIKQSALLDQLETSIEIANQRIADGINVANQDGQKKEVALFNFTLTLVSDDKVIKQITDQYFNSRVRNHSCAHLKPTRIFEVRNNLMDVAFKSDGEKVGNVKRLWHGTRSFNLLSILKRGFVLPRQLSTVQTTGAMYGNGLYFSANSTKSLNYSYGYWDGGNRNQNCYMFLVDVAMGKEYIAHSSGNGNKPGYDSCWAKPGISGVINDEQIVYRTSQANIKYLVEFN